jgi:thymidine phosphorylase
MLLLGKITADADAARRRLERAIADGSALAKFREIIIAQGGDARVVDDYARLPQARVVREVPAPCDGYVTDVDPLAIAQAALFLGAGRAQAAAVVDPAVGISGLVQMGDSVAARSRLAMIHAQDEAGARAAISQITAAVTIGPKPVTPPRLIDELVE